MDQLDQDAQLLLQRVREAREPQASDKARMDALLAASLGIAAGSSAGAAAASTTKAAAAGFGLKAALASTLLVVAGFSGYFGWHAVHDNMPPAAAASVAPPRAPAVPPAPPTPAATSDEAAAPASEVTQEQPPTAAAHKRLSRKPSLPDELDLLHEAQLRWRAGDAAAALRSLRRHRQRFPHSELASERNALTALCLCTLGRRNEGLKQARRIIAQEPHSPLRASLEETCLRYSEIQSR
jgi:RNA polymerase sigma-70 factor (ECF subfamily)